MANNLGWPRTQTISIREDAGDKQTEAGWLRQLRSDSRRRTTRSREAEPVGRRGEGVGRVPLRFKSLLKWIRKYKAFVARVPEFWMLNVHFAVFYFLI